MKFSYPFLTFCIILLLAFSCKKDDPVTPAGSGENIDSTYSQYGTPYSEIPETSDLVMYEVNLRAFSSGGDLKGVTARLDELKALWVNVIWLMPIHPIGQIKSVNSPYSVKDYKAVSVEYGSLADLRKLTDEAHARDMAVILDWVANHTSWDNAWMTNKSWYTQNASGNVIHPAGTNWQDVADLNYTSTDMRLAMIDAMKYWVLEANIDGYRCDYADGVPFDFWKQAIDTLEAIPDRELVMLAEGNRADHYEAGFDLTYAWEFYGALKDVFGGQPAGKLFIVHQQEYSNVPAEKHKLRFTTNHDESAWDKTPMVIFNGKDGALAASAVTVFMGGVPLLYTGQEVGTMNTVPFFSNSSINWNGNPDMLLHYKAMMSFYTNSVASRKGTLTQYPHNDVVCFTKTHPDEIVLVMVNIRNQPVTYNLPAAFQNTVWLEPNSATGFLSLYTDITLAPYEYLLLKN